MPARLFEFVWGVLHRKGGSAFCTHITACRISGGLFHSGRKVVISVCTVDGLVQKAEIMDESSMARAVTRISFEMIERNKGTDSLCLIGLFSRGAVLAKRIAARIAEIDGGEIPVGLLDITPFRDDMPGQQRDTIRHHRQARCDSRRRYLHRAHRESRDRRHNVPGTSDADTACSAGGQGTQGASDTR